MVAKNFYLKDYQVKNLESNSVTWKSPSNIALIKYWGKTEPQIPKNASISFTLSDCHTTTELKYSLRNDQPESFDFDVFFEGKKNPSFKTKIGIFFERISDYVPFIKDLRFEIHTENSFPHSSGIASSASGLSALALCLMSIEKGLKPNMTEAYFLKKASFLARLGSGSAARSIEGPLVVWGEHSSIEGSSNIFGIKYPYKVHPVFESYQDTVLLVDKGVKQVSSTLGHKLMEGHPFAESRFNQANSNLEKLLLILKNGDLNGFIDIVEKEALSLHAMMMTSDPYFILMQPNTLEIINRVWAFRKRTKSHVCFTLDAGANVHVLYPKAEKNIVNDFIANDLVDFCQKNLYICDKAGAGASKK